MPREWTTWHMSTTKDCMSQPTPNPRWYRALLKMLLDMGEAFF